MYSSFFSEFVPFFYCNKPSCFCSEKGTGEEAVIGRIGKQTFASFKLLIYIAFVAITGFNYQAHAQGYTGMDLIKECSSLEKNRDMFCLGYLRGFTNGVIVGQQFAQLGHLLCLPSGVTPEQLRLIVQKFARDNPVLLNQDALVVTGRAVLDAFRCQQGQKPKYD